MSKRYIYIFGGLSILVFLLGMLSLFNEPQDDFSEKAKVSLRDVGHQLLLTNQDSTSIILPVVALNNSKYSLEFQNQLSFEPGNLVAIVKRSFEKANLPANYRVEVINCTDREVAYSYEIQLAEEKSIIPCAGRFLPTNCYTIEVRFINKDSSFFNKVVLWYVGVLSVFGFLFYTFRKRKKKKEKVVSSENHAVIGSFRFYPEENKLVKAAVEISLSKKECELLAIFVASPNQIIKRDELMKRVWEDNGVFVGRSLDTYISKLRKKLQDDDSIKLTNVHGVGYKLEVTV